MFAHDTVAALVAATALVNTSVASEERLRTPADLNAFLDRFGYTGRRDGTPQELALVKDLRRRLWSAWRSTDLAEVVGLINALLADAAAVPYLTDHDQSEWHLHVTRPQAPLVDRLAAEAAMAFADLVRAGELDRLRTCAADDCEAAVIDVTRNRSRRFCDTGNCGNRQHVAAYRARRAAADMTGPSAGRTAGRR